MASRRTPITTKDDLPMRRVAALWSWLPAFRAVAETENLRRAARYLALSPPALSRSLKLLEEAVGRPLFHRDGRRLRLTDEGRGLLLVVRRAMRSVDDATMRRVEPTIRIHAPPPIAPIVAEALSTVGNCALVTHALGTTTLAALLRGAIDLAVVPEPVGMIHKDFAQFPLGELRWGVFGLAASDAEPIAAASLGSWDGWPSDRARQVILEVDDLASALAIARRGVALALPVRLAPEHLVCIGETWSVAFVAVRRARAEVGEAGSVDRSDEPVPADALLAALRRAFAD